MVASSRELFDNEVTEFVAQHGYEPIVVPVAVDAVALYVHKDNPLAGLTIDQADAIFSTTRNRGYTAAITQWGQLKSPKKRGYGPKELKSCPPSTAVSFLLRGTLTLTEPLQLGPWPFWAVNRTS